MVICCCDKMNDLLAARLATIYTTTTAENITQIEPLKKKKEKRHPPLHILLSLSQ